MIKKIEDTRKKNNQETMGKTTLEVLLKTRQRTVLLIVGIALWGASLFCYFVAGYSLTVLFSWMLGIFMTGLFFASISAKTKLSEFFDFTDLCVVASIIILFAPLYLGLIYYVPFQVNTDEISIGNAARDFSSEPGADVFAPSSYFHFPAFIFILFGKLAGLMGGIDFLNLRIIHAVFGILIAIPCYFFFRLLLPRFYAASATILVLGNHALLAVSRMVNRNNVAVLNETAAFLLLMIGLRKRSPFYSFLGGAVAGVSFYHYPVSQVIFPLWLFSLVGMAIFFKKKFYWKELAILASVSVLGFGMVVGPNLVASSKMPDGGGNYGRRQILLFPEGRSLQQNWYSLKDPIEGVRHNITQGFTMFNSPIVDQAYIYPNPGHGFLDRFSGILLWIGLLIVLGKLLFSPKKKEENVIIVLSFLALWAIYMFILGQAPNYTRLFLIIPFVCFFIVEGIRGIIYAVETLVKKHWRAVSLRFRYAIFGLVVSTIFFSNLLIFADFAKKGLADGHDVGSTGRYIEARKYIPDYSFYIAADTTYPYYSWGEASAWKNWAQFFANKSQTVEVLEPQILDDSMLARPFTIFMSHMLWLQYKDTLSARYPQFRMYAMKSDGSIIAVEIE